MDNLWTMADKKRSNLVIIRRNHYVNYYINKYCSNS
jgi:hypothetical protein